MKLTEPIDDGKNSQEFDHSMIDKIFCEKNHQLLGRNDVSKWYRFQYDTRNVSRNHVSKKGLHRNDRTTGSFSTKGQRHKTNA